MSGGQVEEEQGSGLPGLAVDGGAADGGGGAGGTPLVKSRADRVPVVVADKRRPEAMVMPLTVDQLRPSPAPLATKVSAPRTPLSGVSQR